jgi:hypothetical protein
MTRNVNTGCWIEIAGVVLYNEACQTHAFPGT